MTSRSLSASVLFLTLVVGIALTSSIGVQGQSTYGSVSGAVTDSTGAAVVGAQVTLTNTGTSEKHTQTTNDQGTYSFVNVIPGEYRIDIEKNGFKHYSHPNVVVQVQLDTHVETPLTVGAASETVEVTSETSLLQTESSSLGQVVEERKANELPLNGRNIFKEPVQLGQLSGRRFVRQPRRRISRRSATEYRLHQLADYHSDSGFDWRI